MEGYIKLHRKILDNGIFRKPNVSHLFNYCLLRANWSDKTIVWNGQPLVVERGSFVTGRKQIALDTGLSEQNVRSALRTLSHFSMVQKSTSKSTIKFSYLTVCNYDDYQHIEDEGNQQTNQQPTSNQPAINQQPTTNKNNKTNNTKNTNKKTNIASGYSDVFEKWWGYWRDDPNTRKNPGTKTLAERYWKEQNKKLSAEQIQKATVIYLKTTGEYHKAAERFLNPVHGLVQQSLDDKPPRPAVEVDRIVDIEKDWTNTYREARRMIAGARNKTELQVVFDAMAPSWKEKDKILQMLKDTNLL